MRLALKCKCGNQDQVAFVSWNDIPQKRSYMVIRKMVLQVFSLTKKKKEKHSFGVPDTF